MIYKINEIINPEDISSLREAVGWNRMEQEFRNPLLISYCHIGVYDGSKLIGYIDSISNGVTDAYIQDLMIHPNYQGNITSLSLRTVSNLDVRKRRLRQSKMP